MNTIFDNEFGGRLLIKAGGFIRTRQQDQPADGLLL
jgi:hypothetical protein